jgi:hypothetical protein
MGYFSNIFCNTKSWGSFPTLYISSLVLIFVACFISNLIVIFNFIFR